MVERTRELELSLGNGEKSIEKNEIDTVILQRRSIRLVNNLSKDSILSEKDLCFLRPCPSDGIPPYYLKKVVGMKLNKSIEKGKHLTWKDLK